MSSPLENLEHVGPQRAKYFQHLGVLTLDDLLHYFPRDYVNENEERPIDQLVNGQFGVARGEVVAVNYVAGKPRSRFEATLADGTERLAVVWFNAQFVRKQVKPGDVLRLRGTVGRFRNVPQMVNPKYEHIAANDESKVDARVRPVYAASSDLPSEAIARVIADNIEAITANVPEILPAAILEKHDLMPRRDAYKGMHAPSCADEAAEARRRMVYDELLLLQLALGIARSLRQVDASPPLKVDRLLDQRIRARFPFELTAGQTAAIHDIVRDIRSEKPMNRLLQGDVGSGKTVVALYAMLAAVANKMQATLLAPTEVLAEQHFLSIRNMLAGSAVRVELFTGRSKQRDRGNLLPGLAGGDVHIAIGTQALIQQDIDFASLGLVVIDEQHRLGVRQRATLKQKGRTPHTLIMTATPIPRTLALSFFADFDVSTIDELPPGRTPIASRLFSRDNAERAYAVIRQQVATGRQAFVVVPQIEDDGTSRAVISHARELAAGALKGLRIEILHGQMTTEEKAARMAAFRKGDVDVLVATTVIEVGIDVPNASVILIESAESFGLAQLHQLRGRVGRGKHASFCLLVADSENPNSRARLEALVSTASGFDIAEADLRLRGPGQFFGLRQHGLPELRVADLTSELKTLQQARDDALELLRVDPLLSTRVHRPLRDALLAQFGETLRLADIG